jgi:hypothetical protein
LHDLETAIELNDNRAVYRSRLLLDSDLAARSASIARIYTDLGFQQRALVEGWNSVNTDPSDFSGHRFLADTYSVLPRHEIARVSELLQSQLLQPLNVTPIQPRLGESNLFVLSGAGPADPSFNEFNPLFNRNRVALQASGIVGENSTWGEEFVASGIYNKASFSLGQFHYTTDGFRINNDLKDNIYNAFLQWSLFPQTTVQGEFRYRDNERGDLGLRFFPNDFSPNLRINEETSSIRLGFHHTFAPGSDLIGNFMYQDVDATLDDIIDIPPPVSFRDVFNIDTDEDAFSAELQYLYRSKYLNFTAGGGYFDVDMKDLMTDYFFDTSVTPPVFLGPDLTPGKTDVRHTNLYLYSYINYLKNITFTIGASADFYDEESKKDQNQFNPKLGITWDPLPSTTIRGAVFRTFKRTLVTNQTLEPTQVAGFNQFFDDVNATDSWRYGIGLDQKIAKDIYGGVEYSQRDLEVPIDAPPRVVQVDWKERLGRAYLYWTPHKWVALNVEYQYERFDRDSNGAYGIHDVDTHRVPLGINFFHPSGLSAMLKGTYINQTGHFMPVTAGAVGGPLAFTSGEDNFWLFDAAISYRLPKRYGFISVGAKNLFDKSFKYYDTNLSGGSEPVSPAIQPDSFVYLKVTLALP